MQNAEKLKGGHAFPYSKLREQVFNATPPGSNVSSASLDYVEQLRTAETGGGSCKGILSLLEEPSKISRFQMSEISVYKFGGMKLLIYCEFKIR